MRSFLKKLARCFTSTATVTDDDGTTVSATSLFGVAIAADDITINGKKVRAQGRRAFSIFGVAFASGNSAKGEAKAPKQLRLKK